MMAVKELKETPCYHFPMAAIIDAHTKEQALKQRSWTWVHFAEAHVRAAGS